MDGIGVWLGGPMKNDVKRGRSLFCGNRKKGTQYSSINYQSKCFDFRNVRIAIENQMIVKYVNVMIHVIHLER